MRKLIPAAIILLYALNPSAQVPVSKEPYHPVVFENNKVRLLNVKLPPGDTTQYHIHSTPSVFIFFTKTTTGSQLINQQPTSGTSTAGHVLFENLDTPFVRIHRVWNTDTSTFHVMDIELLSNSKTRLTNKALTLPHTTVHIDTTGVRVYNVVLDKDEKLNLNKKESGLLLVSLYTGRIEIKQDHKKSIANINEGQFYWIDPSNNFLVKNIATASANFVYYFGATDGLGSNFQLWKSDGTTKGTVKLKNITPGFGYYYGENLFCISNNMLFFSAYDFNYSGAELWKTNGTAVGTQLVKDINPFYSSYPNRLIDVKGTLFFTADDGVHGNEVWTSKGSEKDTKLVKDIEPGYGSIYFDQFCSAGGKLFFANATTYPNKLWSSDGTAANTDPVDGISGISGLTGSGNNVFFGMYTYKYGQELYVGNAGSTTLIANKVGADVLDDGKTAMHENGLFPNPATNIVNITTSGDSKQNSARIFVTNESGISIQTKEVSRSGNIIQLDVSRLARGIYNVKIVNNDKTTFKQFIKL